MEKIFEYLLAAIKAIFAFFGKEFNGLNDETKDNLETMYDNITGFNPEA